MKNNKKKKVILGITGSFGCGKTTCARMFRRLGASVISADRIYHRLIKSKGLIYKRIVSAFGPDILKDNRQIDREKLGKIVFSQKHLLKKLSRITHPAIINNIKYELTRLKKAGRAKAIVIDAPLLIESGLTKMIDSLIVVRIDRKNQIKRCKNQRGLSRDEIIKRIKGQLPLSKKIKLADYVIDNNGTLKQTREQIKKIWKNIQDTYFG